MVNSELLNPCLNGVGVVFRSLLVVAESLSCVHVERHLITTSGYIGEFEIVDDHRGGKVVVELIGRINKCGVISPRFDLTIGAIEQWTSNLLPSRQFGYVVLTTSLGIMDHEEARRKSTGGKILGFFY
eukprot:749204-Hanusia_phi.AAC.3